MSEFKTYRVQIKEIHQMCGAIEVQAESEGEAKREALDAAREGAVDLRFDDGWGTEVVAVDPA